MSTPNFDMESPRSSLQQPVNTTRFASDYLHLLSALDDGWILIEAMHLLASGRNDEGDSYLLTLMHPQRMHECKLQVRSSAQIEKLLDSERVPMP